MKTESMDQSLVDHIAKRIFIELQELTQIEDITIDDIKVWIVILSQAYKDLDPNGFKRESFLEYWWNN